MSSCIFQNPKRLEKTHQNPLNQKEEVNAQIKSKMHATQKVQKAQGMLISHVPLRHV